MPFSTPLMFTSTMRSHSSTFNESMSDNGITPALFTSTSTRPYRSTAASTKDWNDSREVTSSGA